MKSLFAARAKFSRLHAKNLIHFDAYDSSGAISMQLQSRSNIIMTSLAIVHSAIAIYGKSVFASVLDK